MTVVISPDFNPVPSLDQKFAISVSSDAEGAGAVAVFVTAEGDLPESLVAASLARDALAAAESVLIPMQCEYYAMEGLSVISGLVERMRTSGANPKIQVDGVVMTMYSHTRLSDDVVEQVRSHYGETVYNAIIPRSVRASEAPSFGLPVVAYAPSSPVAEAYFAFGKEFLARTKLRDSIAKSVDLPATSESASLA